MADLRKRGIVTKVRSLKSGQTIGGIPFTRGPLAHFLRNRFYIGEVVFKGEVFPGQQPVILDREGTRSSITKAGMMTGPREQEDAVSPTRFINPQALSKPPGYTHVVEATAPARLVYLAGQLGIDREGRLSSDFRLQAVQTFENLKTALAAVDGQFQHVVKLNNYLVDLKYLPIFRQVRDSYLADERRPASTTIAISGLAREGALLEIEAVAVLPALPRKKAASSARGRRSATKVARRKAR